MQDRNFTFEDGVIRCRDAHGVELGRIEFEPCGVGDPNDDGVVNVTHTFVEPAGRGRGVAAALCAELAGHLRRAGLKARLTCTYAQRWFGEHPDAADVVADA
ncbi:GNAT family N-acetyltransferase [Olsenella sp. HMSC062G07]|uniref:GNAT family N-acetyltransferase n=1 Tax=Olsenella sp. HMSC062G07 TaxID=1739330 RepID=UPI0008A5DD82|nr:GNAT family N-acetyltransferase [Olsenella sp. HMSC062G07]OFK22699.1 hypothetical protein HMPREF2826_01150 [Olsenella sp. HMSC062G07]